MARSIIIGVDGSTRGDDACVLGGALARLTDSPVLVAHAVPQAFPDSAIHPSREEWTPEQEAEGGLDRAGELVGEAAEIGRAVVLARSVAAGLHWLAEEENAEMIVVGSSHRGAAGRLTVGSVGERLLHGSPCPVAMAPQRFEGFSKGVIGVAFDDSPQARAALAFARGIAERAGTAVRILAVFDTSLEPHRARAAADGASFTQRLRQDLQTAVQSAASELPAAREVSTVFEDGDPATVLREHSGDLDLLICGSRAYGPIRTVLLGGVSHVLVRDAGCPVVVIPRAG